MRRRALPAMLGWKLWSGEEGMGGAMTHPTVRPVASRGSGRRGVALLVAALLAIGCDTATLSPVPGSRDPSGAPAGTTGPGDTGGPLASGADGIPATGEEPAALPLPVPTLAEPFAIGEALYDPTRMDDAVVSMLTLMGIGIYARDGSVIRKGDEVAEGDPWLTEDEVWGLIDVGIEDLLSASDDGPNHRLGDLYDALSPMLPGTSRDAFIAAYGDTYADRPEDLAPQLLLGQPVDASTPLTRTQLWLLFIDGFVPLATPRTSLPTTGQPVATGGRPPSGTAARALPDFILDSPENREWQDLRMHMLTIGFAIPFYLLPVSDIHEGHDGESGGTWSLDAIARPGRPFVSPTTGRTILQPISGPMDGLLMTWESSDESVWSSHGSLGDQLPAEKHTDEAGSIAIQYTTKREVADGSGLEASEVAPLTATVDVVELIRSAYQITDDDVDWLLATGFIAQRRKASGGGFPIGWHAPGIELLIKDIHEVTLNVMPFGGAGFVYRKGQDTFSGTLWYDDEDLTYRGTLRSTTIFDFRSEFATPLAQGTCEDVTASVQYLSVVGRVVPTVASETDASASGPFDGGDLILSFYPTSSRLSGQLGHCQSTIPYVGPGPDGAPMFGRYTAFLDSRITTPSTGYRIHLPLSGTLTYQDWSQFEPDSLVDSVFHVTVKRADGPT